MIRAQLSASQCRGREGYYQQCFGMWLCGYRTADVRQPAKPRFGGMALAGRPSNELGNANPVVADKPSTMLLTGPFAEAAHATNDTAPGGLIALSAAAFDRLKNAHKHRGGGSGTPDAKGLLDNIMIVYAGHHDLSQAPPTGKASAAPQPSPPAPSRTGSSSQLPASCDDDSADVTAAMASALDTVLDVDPCPGFTAAAAAAAAAAAVPDTDGTPLYVALPRALLCRLAYLPPLRTAREVQLGSLRAPTGCVCIGFVKVVGAGALMADVPAVATRALAAFHSLVCRCGTRPRGALQRLCRPRGTPHALLSQLRHTTLVS